MLDRISLYPGRVTLTPVAGQANTYDMERADSPTQEGTPLNKANLLTDAVAAQFGLDGVVPNDIFAWLGKYNEHWWSLYHDQSSEGYSETLTNSTSSYSLTGRSDSDSVSVKTNTLYFSKTISIDQSTGAISLVSPESYTMSNDATNEDFIDRLISLAPVYVTGLLQNDAISADIILVPEGATRNPISGFQRGDVTFAFNYWVGGSAYGNRWNWYTYPYDNAGDKAVKVVSSKHWFVSASQTTYEHSTDRNAYPDSGTVSGITYSYLGVPFEKFPTMPRIEMGTYVGTGTYGASNPNTIAFSQKPKIIFSIPYDYHALLVIMPDTITGTLLYPVGDCMLIRQRVSYVNGSLSWHVSNANTNQQAAEYQHNYLGTTYHYIAVF